MENIELLTINEVGKIIGLGRTKVYDLIDDGALPALKIGRATRIARRDVEGFLKACPRKPPKKGPPKPAEQGPGGATAKEPNKPKDATDEAGSK